MKNRISLSRERLYEGLRAPFSSRRLSLITLLLINSFFVLLNLAARPQFSFQMISANPLLFLEAVGLVFVYNNPGPLQMFFTSLYAVLAGISMTLFYIKYKSSGSGLLNMAGIAPGFLASGCLVCGAGVIAMLGFTGALAALPFNGALITSGASLLLIYFIASEGDPRKCYMSKISN